MLSSITSSIFEVAAVTALEQRLPLVLVLSSMGADIDEGLPALHGWGRLAAALAECSGSVPTIAIVDGPAVSGPALLLGLADLVGDDRSRATRSSTVRSMVEQFTGVQIVDRGARRLRQPGAPRGCRRALIVDDREAAVAMVEELLAYLPDHVDEEPPALAERRSRRSPVPRGRRADPGVVDRQLRRPQGGRGDRRRRTRCSSCGRRGRPTSSPRSPRSTAGRSASSPTSRCRSPARSTSRPRRRRPGSSRSATPSTCRSSRSSTRPASTPARTSSGGA